MRKCLMRQATALGPNIVTEGVALGPCPSVAPCIPSTGAFFQQNTRVTGPTWGIDWPGFGAAAVAGPYYGPLLFSQSLSANGGDVVVILVHWPIKDGMEDVFQSRWKQMSVGAACT